MPGRKTRPKAVLLAVTLLLLPPVAYAVWLLVLFLLDSLRGDGLILHQYYFESRGLLLVRILSDSLKALPVFYAAAVMLWVVLHLLSRLRSRGEILTATLAGALTGFVAAALLVDMSWGAMVPAIAAGSLLALALYAALRPSSVPR